MKVLINEQGKALINASGKALLEKESAVEPGYVLQLHHTGGMPDNMHLIINGTDECSLLDSTGFYCHIPGKVVKFKVYAQHGGTYPSGSCSWARYKLLSSDTWTNIELQYSEELAEEIILTGNTQLEVHEATCLNKGTLITMADNTKKPVEKIEVGDLVLGYDGSAQKVTKSEKENRAFNGDRDIWKFEDDHEIITTFRHEFYNIEHQKMMYLQDWKIGEHAYSETGKAVALLKHVHEDVPCNFFSLWCDNENYFAGGLLAGNRFTGPIEINPN